MDLSRKTRIAIEFASRMRRFQSSTWIFWVHGANSTRFVESFRSFAERIDLRGRSNPETNILERVAQWLRDEKNGRWLMILDNADDGNIYSTTDVNKLNGREETNLSEYLPLSAYLPQSPNGCILITSRDRRTALRLTDNRKTAVIEIKPMDSMTASELIRKKLSAQEIRDADLPAFAQMLDHIPLAITQACAYIVVEEMTVGQYQEIFQENKSRQLHLLEIDEGDIHREVHSSSAVVTTWQISFKQIMAENPLAAEILSLVAVLDRQGIPKSLLRLDVDSLKLNEALTRLRGFCLIKAERGNESFEMHRLVQFALRAWLSARSEMSNWTLKGLEILCQDFPRDAFFHSARWSQCSLLLPHTRAILDIEYGTVTPKLGARLLVRTMELLNLVGCFLDTQGHFDDAISYHRRAYDIARTCLGPTDPSTLSHSTNIAESLSRQGKYAEAEKIESDNWQQHLKIPLNARDAEWDQLSFQILGNLAASLDKLGKHTEARKYEMYVMEKKLGSGRDKEDAWISMNAAASGLAEEGKLEDAETLSRTTIELQLDGLGLQNQHTLESMRTLAIILNKGKRFAEAEEEISRVIDAENSFLAEGHPDRIRSAKLLAYILQNQGRHLDAETVLRVARTQADNFAAEPSLLKMNLQAELAVMLWEQSKYDEAMTLQIEALALRDELLPSRDLLTYTLMSNLAATFRGMGKIKEERGTRWEILQGLVELSSPDKEAIITALLALAECMNPQQGLSDPKPISICMCILQAQQAQDPGNSAALKPYVTTLSRMLLDFGQWESGLELAMRFRDRSDLSTVQPVMALLQSRIRNKRIAEAAVFLEELIADYTAVLGSEHYVTLTHMEILALLKEFNLSTLEELKRKIASITEGEGDGEFPRTALIHWLPVLLQEIAGLVKES